MIISCSNSKPVDLDSDPKINDFEFASTTCEIIDPLPVSLTGTSTIQLPSSTFPSVSNGFTHGELVVSFFLFLIFSIIIFEVAWNKFLERQ